MSHARIIVLTILALLATHIDAATFTTVRLLSGALMLCRLPETRRHRRPVLSYARHDSAR